MIFFCKEGWMSQMAKCSQLLRHLISWLLLWTDPHSLYAHSPYTYWNPVLTLRHKYDQRASREVHVKENWIFDDWYLKSCRKKNKWKLWVKCFWDLPYYSPRTRKLRIITAPLPREFIQFTQAKPNESVLSWLRSRECEFEWHLQRD